jgi:hypothetical protein
LPVRPQVYREKIHERYREHRTVRPMVDCNGVSSSNTTADYSTVMPRHHRTIDASSRSLNEPVHHLPFEYVPNENVANARTVEYQRNRNEERVAVGRTQPATTHDEFGTTNFTVKFYEHDDERNDLEHRLDRCLHEAREVQEMSMRMSEQRQLGNVDM